MGEPFSALATAGTAFGFNFADKLLTGSTLAVISGPSWLLLEALNLHGTPPSAGVYVVTLQGANSDVSPATQTTTLMVIVSPALGGGGDYEYARWTGQPITFDVIKGQAFSYDYSSRLLPSSATAPGQPYSITGSGAWIVNNPGAKTLTGTPPVGAGSGNVGFSLTGFYGGYGAQGRFLARVHPPPVLLWADPPYEVTQHALSLLTFRFANLLVAGSAVTLQDAPSWLAVVGSAVVGVPPLEAAGTTLAVHLRATKGATIDIAALTIHVTMPAIFINSPYEVTEVEGKQFLFQIFISDSHAEVSASGLPPWLIFQPDVLTFSGVPPFGSGGSVVIVALKGVLGGEVEETSLAITISAKDVLGITIDLRSHTVLFDGGVPTFKHGDDYALVVNFIPPEQAGAVTDVLYNIKPAGSLSTYGTILKNTSSARIGSSAAFQFASQRFANPVLDHLLALHDPIEVQEKADFLFEVGCTFQGRRFTGAIAPIIIARDFALTSSAGATGATGDATGELGAPVLSGLPINAYFGGVPIAAQVFGRYVVPAQTRVVGLQLELQAPDATAPLHLALCAEDGTLYGDAYALQIDAGSKFATVDFADPLLLAQGTSLCAIIDNYAPSDTPAQNLTVRSLCRFVS